MLRDLSIIIVSFNTKNLLKDCLTSIVENTNEIDCEIIVIDNASSDGSEGMVTALFPRVRLMVNKENMGFAKANNLGIRMASGRNILLLNSDTVVLKDALAKTLQFSNNHEIAGVIGCKVLNADRTLQFSCYHFPGLISEVIAFTKNIVRNFPDPFTYYKYMRYWNHKTAKEVNWVSGCFLWVKKEVFDAVGLLDERFFLYYEDTEFCFRVKKNSNYKVFYFPQASIVHLKGQSSPAKDPNAVRNSFESARYYFRKHYGKFFESVFVRLCQWIWAIESWLFFILKWNNKFLTKYQMLNILRKL